MEQTTTNRKRKARSRVSNRGGLYMLIKWLCVFAMGAFLYFQLNGEKVSETGFAQMSSAVTASADLTKMQKANNQMIKRLYGIDPTSYSGVLLYYPLTNMGAEELMLVQMKDVSQKETVQKALEARQAAQVKSFEGYGVEQTAMLKKSIPATIPERWMRHLTERTDPLCTAMCRYSDKGGNGR